MNKFILGLLLGLFLGLFFQCFNVWQTTDRVMEQGIELGRKQILKSLIYKRIDKVIREEDKE